MEALDNRFVPTTDVSSDLREDGAYVFHYPPKYSWQRDPPPEELASQWGLYHFYIHVPFCRRICTFCTFERKQLRRGKIDEFVALLNLEMDLATRHDDFSMARIASVYFGGGTASLLSNSAIAHLISRLDSEFGLDPSAEITLECEPGTKREHDFRELRDIGINRVSIGVQSFDDSILTRLNRAHSTKHSLTMIDASRSAGIGNVHIDLMYGLPSQTAADWRATVATAISLGVQHISAYPLIVFQNEQLDRSTAQGRLPRRLPDYEISELGQYASYALGDAGFHRYSLTEYAQPGFECRYVRATWDGSDYLGMGPGAYSRNGCRLWEDDVLHMAYRQKLHDGYRPAGKSTSMASDVQVRRDIAMGLCMLSVDLVDVLGAADTVLSAAIEDNVSGLVEAGLLHREGQRLSLTERGVRFATHVMKSFTV